MGELTNAIKNTIKELKLAPIDGCITGSSLLDVDFDQWSSHPDIDIFCYSEPAHIHAIDYVNYVMGFEPGKGKGIAEESETWKIDKVRTRKFNKDKPLSTVSLYKDNVTVNITYTKNKTKAADVLCSFDMTIIMKAYDIPSGYTLDWTKAASDNPMQADPNPYRSFKLDLWTVGQWARQHDRVIKYWDRGFDTRPLARFYIKGITEIINLGPLFDTEASHKAYDSFVEEFVPVKERMETWLKEVEDL